MNRLNKIHEFRNRLQNGHAVGVFSKTTDSSFIEAMGFAGIGFVILDMEHGPIGLETLQRHICAAENSGVVPIVRVPGSRSDLVGKVLDVGAAGIQVPSVSSKEQVLEVLDKCKFFPKGHRGVCRNVRAADFSAMPRDQYFSSSNETLVVIQLEGKEGLDNFDSIISCEGIDVIFIGPYDLSQSLGIPGQVDHPMIKDAISDIVKKAAEKGIIIGTYCDTPQQFSFYKELGIKYLSYSVDIAIFVDALKKIV